MSDSTTQDILNKLKQIETIRIEDLNTSSLTVDSSYGTSGFNGISASDIYSLPTSSIPTLSIDNNSINWGVTPTSISTGTFTYGNPNTVWTSTGTGSAVGGVASNGKGGKLQLHGENADIEINGKSLMKLLEQFEQRLNLLTPNTELEAEWDELKELGDRYRELEQRCKEKAETWKKLKAMPPPQVD